MFFCKYISSICIVLYTHSKTFEFNVVDLLVQGLGHDYQGFTGAQEQLWPDALPATTSDSYGYQWEITVL